MKNTDLALQLAKRTGITPAEAADQVDEVVTSILKALKKGRSANIAGIGILRRDVKGAVRFTETRPRGDNGKR